MIILRILLLPFSFIYGLVMQVRNLCYETGIFKVYKFDVHVISVGNITAGGTGKTPFTIWLAGKLIQKGKKIAIVSRGYGRQSKGFHIVSSGDGALLGNTHIHGDEPVLIARSLPDAMVAVSEKRSIAIKYIKDTYKPDIIILDDGFQHRAVHRDLDIVLLKDEKIFKNKWVLPSGLLREFKYNLKRANLLISTDNHKDYMGRERLTCRFESNQLINVDFQIAGDFEFLDGRKCLAFAAIAHPNNFFQNLQKKNIKIVHSIPFKDHYVYEASDLEALVVRASSKGCDVLICTEKDLVKIVELPSIKEILSQHKLEIFAPRLEANVDREEYILQKIEGFATSHYEGGD